MASCRITHSLDCVAGLEIEEVEVVDVDSEAGRRVAAVAAARGLRLISVGRDGETLRLVSAEIDGFGQSLIIEHDGKRTNVRLPLVGAFQASNALVAAGLAMATGASAADVLPLLAPVRVIAANIIATVIQELLPVFRRALAPDGVVIVAGILVSERDAFASAAAADRWGIVSERAEGEWWSATLRAGVP